MGRGVALSHISMRPGMRPTSNLFAVTAKALRSPQNHYPFILLLRALLMWEFSINYHLHMPYAASGGNWTGGFAEPRLVMHVGG